MGRIAAPYGVRGWVKVQPFTAAPDALLGYRTWWIGEGAAEQATRVTEGRLHGAVLLAKLEGIESREDALRYRGRFVAVPRESLPATADDEVYLHELVGLDVVNRRGEPLGRVGAISESGVQPILHVVAEGGIERMIPLVAAIVDEVDLEAARITVDWEADY